MSNRKFILCFSLLLAFAFCAVQTQTVSAKPKKTKYSRLRILSDPGGLLLTIDGKPHGELLTEFRDFDLEPGVHNVWQRESRCRWLQRANGADKYSTLHQR